MTAAVEYLFAMPDRERGLLAGGRGERMTNWPQVVRSVREGDYGDGQGFGGEASASPQLTRRCVDLVERMLTDEKAIANVIAPGHRALVGVVIVMKRWPGADSFGWDRVWSALGGELMHLRLGEVLPATSDAMEQAYRRAVSKVAKRMTALNMAV